MHFVLDQADLAVERVSCWLAGLGRVIISTAA